MELNGAYAVVHDPALVARIAEQPWEVARALGARVSMIERQPIRAVGGRSFASNNGPAPLHTDSQLYRGRPANWQVLGCVRAAKQGGESLIADAHAAAFTNLDRLFREERTFPFVFGDVRATTFAAVGEELIFTHSPRLDPFGVAAQLPVERITLRAGELLIVDNHRCAHGRTAFQDTTRELQRILVWLEEPVRGRRDWHARAVAEGRAPVRLVDREVPDDPRREAIVREMIAGVPPGMLAVRYSVPEAWLYAFRDAR